MHARVCWPGVITRFSVASANVHELSVVPEITEGTSGLLVGDRNYHSPKTKEDLASMGVKLLAPYSSKERDPTPRRSAFLSRLRYRIDTVFSQLVERYSIKRVRARPVAFDEPAAEEGAESHVGLIAQPPGGQPISATGEAPPLKPAHGVS